MISIIIPAHNEEKVIEATLKELLVGVDNGSLEVIVVCNGCTDRTAQIVTSLGDSIKCIETATPSKPQSLNIGDFIASGFPRFYLDADVVLTMDAIHKVSQSLKSGKFLAAAPKMRMDYMNSSWAVQRYYEVWQQLPYVREGIIGTGVYALSEEGRLRFDKFPQIIADDEFIRAIFNYKERTSVDNCYSLVRAPKNLRDSLKLKQEVD